MREFSTPVILDQARERTALSGKSVDRFGGDFVNTLILWRLAARSAPIDRGERDLSFELHQTGVVGDFRKCNFNCEKRKKADLCTAAGTVFGSAPLEDHAFWP